MPTRKAGTSTVLHLTNPEAKEQDAKYLSKALQTDQDLNLYSSEITQEMHKETKYQ